MRPGDRIFQHVCAPEVGMRGRCIAGMERRLGQGQGDWSGAPRSGDEVREVRGALQAMGRSLDIHPRETGGSGMCFFSFFFFF